MNLEKVGGAGNIKTPLVTAKRINPAKPKADAQVKPVKAEKKDPGNEVRDSLDVHIPENSKDISACGRDSIVIGGQTVSSLVGGALGPMLSKVMGSIKDSFDYELKKDSRLRKSLKGVNLKDVSKTVERLRSIPTQKELFDSFSDMLVKSASIHSLKKESLFRVMDTAGEYLEINEEPIVVDVPFSQIHPEQAPDMVVQKGWDDDVQAVRTENLKWRNVKEYDENRIGPLAVLIDGMDKNDDIMLSNLPMESTIASLKDQAKVEKLNLPVSSWSKNIHLVTHGDGHRTLMINDFSGKVLMKHYQLLLKSYLSDRDEKPGVMIAESKKQFNDYYNSLNDFMTENQDKTGKLDSVVVGYGEAFKDRWKDHFIKKVKSDDSPWSAEIYETPGKKRVAVLSSHDSYHGEILGENLKKLVENHPEIKEVFTAGSGGSLHIRDAYRVVFPKGIVGKDGSKVENVLNGSPEELYHRSVISPLEETPEFLEKTVKQGTTTLDMEMGYVAQALAGTGVKVGVGILVTDFPIERQITDSMSLTFQDSGKKYEQMTEYADSILKFVDEGKPVFEHKIEKYFGKSLEEISDSNLRWELDNMGELSEKEQKLFDRFSKLTPNYSFRMTGNRLWRVLEDGAVLSTAMVSRYKKVNVKPVTPEIEDKMYGALDYTFGEVSYGHGDDFYGEVNVEIKPEVWQKRSWSSYRSGWRSLVNAGKEVGSEDFGHDNADPAVFKKAMDKFSEWLVVPKDYNRSMAAWAIRQLRNMDPAVTEELLKASDKELPWLIGKHKLMYLEGKIKGSLNLEDIKQVALPENSDKELIRKIREHKIPIKFLSAKEETET